MLKLQHTAPLAVLALVSLGLVTIQVPADAAVAGSAIERTAPDDGAGHDVGDDDGVDAADHDAGDDDGVDAAGHDAGDDDGVDASGHHQGRHHGRHHGRGHHQRGHVAGADDNPTGHEAGR
jgi:hypothetical protein